MTSHPRRSMRVLPRVAPDAIRAARAAAGHSQSEAAAAIGESVRRWEGWEQAEGSMSPGLLQLYLLITGQTTIARAKTALQAPERVE